MEEKIVDRALLAATLEILRRDAPGRGFAPRHPRVVFTNGCFDMLHTGHARYLNEARREGDLLVVAMNDDAGIRRLKGPTRPLLPLRERLKVMAALACTDLVTWFDDETPVALLRELRPELLVKGGDYPVTGVVGWDIVPEWQGEVKVLGLTPGQSTSAIEKRLRAKA